MRTLPFASSTSQIYTNGVKVTRTALPTTNVDLAAGATLGSFVQVCRTLNLDGWIADMEPKDFVSPIAYAEALKKTEAKQRRRAHV